MSAPPLQADIVADILDQLLRAITALMHCSKTRGRRASSNGGGSGFTFSDSRGAIVLRQKWSRDQVETIGDAPLDVEQQFLPCAVRPPEVDPIPASQERTSDRHSVVNSIIVPVRTGASSGKRLGELHERRRVCR
jgi:hypothetical protein